MEPILITPVSEKEFSRTPQRVGGDQYGHQWHSFHSRIVFDESDTTLRDKPQTRDDTDV
jgi:hypothetical protein